MPTFRADRMVIDAPMPTYRTVITEHIVVAADAHSTGATGVTETTCGDGWVR